MAEFGWTSLVVAGIGGYALHYALGHKAIDANRQQAASALIEQVDQLLEAGLPTKTQKHLKRVRKALLAVHDGAGDDTMAQKVFGSAKEVVSGAWTLAKRPFQGKIVDDTSPHKRAKKAEGKTVKAKAKRKVKAKA